MGHRVRGRHSGVQLLASGMGRHEEKDAPLATGAGTLSPELGSLPQIPSPTVPEVGAGPCPRGGPGMCPEVRDQSPHSTDPSPQSGLSPSE